MEIPLPIPFSLICSPSHMTSAVPATKQAMMTMALNQSPPPKGVLVARTAWVLPSSSVAVLRVRVM